MRKSQSPVHFDPPIAARIDDWLRQQNGKHRRLTAHECRQREEYRISSGWRLDVLICQQLYQFDVCIDDGFPHTAAHVFLVDPPKVLTWPHVQGDGLLCLLPNTAQVDFEKPVQIVREVLAAAIELLEELISNGKVDDFRSEFDSYWSQVVDEKANPVISLLDLKAPSRSIVVCHRRNYYLTGETKNDVMQWIFNRSGKPTDEAALSKASFVWLKQPWLPSEYPSTAEDVLNLVETAGLESQAHIQQLLDGQSSTLIVVGAPTGNGPTIAGITLHSPVQKNLARHIERGFRVGRTPAKLKRSRMVGSSTVQRTKVHRMDAEWIHGRGTDFGLSRLRSAKALILGCGSIGAPVAMSLAQAGVGSLGLVDPDQLTAANIGRHPLGAESLSEYKTKALADRIKRGFPHICSVQTFEDRFEQLLMEENSPLLNDVSVVVSVTGNWGSESFLNKWHSKRGRELPIIYGWTEPYACAGHAVAIVRNGGCLLCGFTSSGHSHFDVTEWPSVTTSREPGCGTHFQPYGPVELSHIIAMITEVTIDAIRGDVRDSIHHIWAGRRKILEAHGGTWTDKWLSLVHSDKDGGRLAVRPWPIEESCSCRENGSD